ncbi:MAG: hypothetical protein GYA35_09120 [Thermoanaerobaculaceae bacterium]|nr:hypothetical protein [Thermoanaerobaculaceae bacterium]
MATSVWKEIELDERALRLGRERDLSLLEANIVSRLLHPRLEGAYFNQEPLSFDIQIPNLDESAKFIAKAIKDGKKILVHGDYDTDGIMGTTILYSGLKSLKANVSFFIPSRFENGYGLSSCSVDAAKREKADVVLTVDCGTNSKDVQIELESLGVALVVTDHHIPEKENLVDSFLVNPFLGNDEEAKMLSGATVGYLLLRKVAENLNEILPEEPFLRLCGIATVSDVVPIGAFNWNLCKKAFSALQSSPSPGLNALLKKCPMPPYRCHHIAFYLSPRLNAAGRMEDANLVLDILLERDLERAEDLVEKLEELNTTRRYLQAQMAEEIEKNFGDDDLPFLFCASERFHLGLLGPVASRLCQEKNKSVFLISVDGESATGSARSVEDVDITSLLRESEGIFKRLGGHERAAGFTLETSNIVKLREFLEKKYKISDSPKESVNYYFFIQPKQTEIVWEILGKLDPIEPSIKHPCFALETKQLSPPKIIKDKHLLWNIPLNNGRSVSAFYFDALSKISKIPTNERLIVGRILPDKLRSNPNFFFEVKDII